MQPARHAAVEPEGNDVAGLMGALLGPDIAIT